MKKFLFLAALIFTSMLVACGDTTTYIYDDDYIYHAQEYGHDLNGDYAHEGQGQDANGNVLGIIADEAPELTLLDTLLYDFDYLVRLLEDTFPHFGAIYRTLGVDTLQRAAEVREMIVNYPYSMQEFAYSIGMALEDMPPLDAHVLRSIIHFELFGYVSLFAHLLTLDHELYVFNRGVFRHAPGPHRRFNNQAFQNFASMTFYREYEDLWNSWEDNPELFHFLYRIPDFLLENIEHISDLGTQFTAALSFSTEIIEEGRIALLNAPTFWSLNDYRSMLIDFYTRIQNYEHLIIDMRGNGGGFLDFPRAYIMHVLMPDRDNLPDLYIYALFNNSEMGRYLGEILRQEWKAPHPSSRLEEFVYISRTDLLSIDDIQRSGSLVYLSEDDRHLLGYGFKVCVSLRHLNDSVRALPHIPFNGRIWLLTCRFNYSAAAIFAHQAREMDFATLVGENTCGGYTLWPTFFVLPNTGIVVRWDADMLVDAYGRPLNEFTTPPHYFNREGMDALETVLEMIRESRE